MDFPEMGREGWRVEDEEESKRIEALPDRKQGLGAGRLQ
jgi:hypothetical protein